MTIDTEGRETMNKLARPVDQDGSSDLAAGGSWRQLVLRRLIRSPSAMVGLALMIVVVLLALLAPVLTPYDPIGVPATFSLADLNALPSGTHPFGTDYLGRDLLSRVLYGGRLSLPAGLGSVLIAFSIGVPLGTIAGFIGRFLDDIIMRAMDMLLAFPGIILAIGIVTILGPSLISTVIAIGIVGIPGYARIARGQTLQARELDYTLAARSTGAGPLHIVFRHIIPNVVDPIVVLATLNLGGAILATAALSFIGLGTQPPAPNWGVLLSNGYEHMFQSWAELVFPALAIVISVLGINLLGDGLADALNPRVHSR
jgi:peptide/nickel transport system permease protein